MSLHGLPIANVACLAVLGRCAIAEKQAADQAGTCVAIARLPALDVGVCRPVKTERKVRPTIVRKSR